MNIDKIVKECPRAWYSWLSFAGIQTREGDVSFEYKHNRILVRVNTLRLNGGFTTYKLHFRELYDFFDSEGLLILLNANYQWEWLWKVQKDGFRWSDGVAYKTRTEAEYTAFEKAFEIVNNKEV